MEIHKPKPIHNWRDFIKEIGVIVIGVSIALAGEQAVEKWREHRQYVDSREAMNVEIASDLYNLSRRHESAPCNSNRLNEIGSLLDKAKNHQPFPPPSWIGAASSFRLRFSSEPESGRSGLFSPEEQRRYSTVYSYLRSIDLEQDRERLAWAKFEPLEGETQLTPEMIQALRMALAESRFENGRIEYLMGWANYLVRQFEIPTARRTGLLVNSPTAWPTCIPLNSPKEEALSRSAMPFK